MRGLGAHLIPPHLGAAPWGRGELDLAPLGLGPGYCIVPVRARSGVFDTSPPPPSLPCAGVLTSPHLWGYAQGRTASPFHPSRESPPFQIETECSAGRGCRRVLRWRQSGVPGPLSVCGPTQPVWGERFLGSPRSWRQAASSAGRLRGPDASRFAAPFSAFNRISK